MSDGESDEVDPQQLDPYSDDSDKERKLRCTCSILNLSKKLKHHTLKDLIKNEYKKYGTVRSLTLEDKDDNRFAVLQLADRREVRRACEATDGRYLFNAIVDVYDSSETDKHEFPFFSSRTLFIGNLEKVTTYEDLKRTFFKYGKILKIDLKKISGVTRYAFVQFAKLDDARLAVHRMQREKLGKNIVTTCYARSIKSQVLWFSGSLPYRGHEIDPAFGESFFRRQFEQFGTVRSLILDRRSPKQSQILVAYADVTAANKAYIEFKENRRKLTNARWSCDFASEELVQSVTEDMHKNSVLLRSDITNNWGDIIAKLKKAQEDDDFRMVGSDYEYRKYSKLSERIDRDNSAERKRYRSRDTRSRSRERYRSNKRSRSRSRGRESPRRKKSKSGVSFGRVHSPSPRHQSRRRSTSSSSSGSRSRSRSFERDRSSKKPKKRRKKSRYDEKKKRSSRDKKSYWDKGRRRSPSDSMSSSSDSSSDRSTSTERSSKARASTKLKMLSVNELESMSQDLNIKLGNYQIGKLPRENYPKVTIENDHFKERPADIGKLDGLNIEKTISTNTKGNVVIKVNKQIEPHKLPMPVPQVFDSMFNSKKVEKPSSPTSKKDPEEKPIKRPLDIRDRRHLKDDEGGSTPTLDEEEASKGEKKQPLKKGGPIVLPVLPPAVHKPKATEPKPVPPPTTPQSASREKPREQESREATSPKRPPSSSFPSTPMGKHGKKKQMAQMANSTTENGVKEVKSVDKEKRRDEERRRRDEQKRREAQKQKEEAKKKPQKSSQAPNPKKGFLIRAGPTKKFLEDPNRLIGEEDYDDFRKEILHALNEVKQESEHLPEPDEPFTPVLLDSPIRQNPSLIDYFSCNNTGSPAPSPFNDAPEQKLQRKLPSWVKKKAAKPGSGVMELAKVQTYLNRIIKPEEFSIQANVKRLDIFEEDKQRISTSPWMSQDAPKESPLISQPGVFNFYPDWNQSIRTDLEHLSAAVEQVLGIGVQQNQPNNVDVPPSDSEKQEDSVLKSDEKTEGTKAGRMEPNNSSFDDEVEGITSVKKLSYEVDGDAIVIIGDSDEEKKYKKKTDKRRDSLKEGKKEKKEKDKKKKKTRKPSSDIECLGEKKRSREKKPSEEGSETNYDKDDLSPVSRKISEVSGSSGSPIRIVHSSSPTSDLMSPEHPPPQTDLDIREVDKTNQSVRERMENMVRIKKTQEKRQKSLDKKRRRSSVFDPEEGPSNAQVTRDAVRNLSFEDKNESKEAEEDSKQDSDNDRDAELDAALAGLEEDYEAPKKQQLEDPKSATKTTPEPKPKEEAVKTEPGDAVQVVPAKQSISDIVVPLPVVPQEENVFRKRYKLPGRRDSFKTEINPTKIEPKSEPQTAIASMPTTESSSPSPSVKVEPDSKPLPAELAQPATTDKIQSPFRPISSPLPKHSSPVKVSLPNRRHSQPEVSKPELMERVERKLSTASGTSEISNASAGFSTPILQLHSHPKLEITVPPASKRHTPGPIRLRDVPTTISPKPSQVATQQAIQGLPVQTVLSPTRMTLVQVPPPVRYVPVSHPRPIQPASRHTVPLNQPASPRHAPQQLLIHRAPIPVTSVTSVQPKTQLVPNFIQPGTFGTFRMMTGGVGQARQVLITPAPTSAPVVSFTGTKQLQTIASTDITKAKDKKTDDPAPVKQTLSYHIPGSSQFLNPMGHNITGLSGSHIMGSHHHQQIAQIISPAPPQSNRPQQVDRERLLLRHKLLWQGYLCIKNDTATVHLNLIHGNPEVPQRFLPREEPLAPQGATTPAPRMGQLKIVQRMRLEPNQLEKVHDQIQQNTTSCTMVALPCGTNEGDVHRQTDALQKKFIEYLTEKHAAGIVNVNSVANLPHVLHIFPPCEFTTNTLRRLAPDFLQMVHHLPMMLVVIAPA